jgi:hypothetical protein
MKFRRDQKPPGKMHDTKCAAENTDLAAVPRGAHERHVRPALRHQRLCLRPPRPASAARPPRGS